ncbi:hypothetical protein L873DRAFT_1707483 [Choiromyces venosus 120613-1]|uniref:Uncharacterized protein n=1 Tax=Choiromyces venosus 120613-1 TaxID=1336337 RepID=A0A3N4J7K0_9PEZI|nr:hypothetical protein L873DRAFT_1707483 [Choiromyces venosus 120613-1]
MFNRLPIYTRPKEPAIGFPVLMESTNQTLSGLPSSHIVGFPEYLGGSNAFRNSGESVFKGLPEVPTSSLSAGSRQSLYEDDLAPPPPLRINKNPSPPGSSSSANSNRTVKPDSNKQPIIPNYTTNAPPRKLNITRKPAPSNFSSANSTHSSDTFVASGLDKAATMDFSSSSSLHAQPRGRGFGLGNVVKGKMTGRRKQDSDLGAESPIPVAVVKPPNFVSIDDWLDTREREGLHRRSNTVSTVSTQAPRYKDPIKLHIRQSTFAPLTPPTEMSLNDSPAVPSIPAQYIPPPRLDSIRAVSAPLPPHEIHPVYRPSSVPKDEPQEPRDHISQLEYEQDQLTMHRTALRREIYDLEQVLPPNPSTHNPVARREMQARRDQLVQDLADVEKEVHEMGMKLHRAWRRRDKKMGREGPTHLWVSRVTGREDE